MHYKKQTSWKKSRKFGDVMGGRMRPKITDKVFNRMHNFHPPADGDEVSVFLIDHPTRDFLFQIGNAVESLYQRFWSKAAGDKTEKRVDNLAKIWSETFI